MVFTSVVREPREIIPRSTLISILGTFHDPSGENIRFMDNLFGLLPLCLESRI